jgi:electron transport complex protein RnfB
MLTSTSMITAAALLTVMAIAFGVVLGWANRTFHVEVDPKVEAINDALPGANCGGCGFVGCSEYAEAVAKNATEVDLCGPGGQDCATRLAKIMGVEVEESFPYRAVVHCAAHGNERLQKRPYDGENTCVSANLVGGVQGCTYGCLGLGDCQKACQYDAINIERSLSTIDYDKCIGCKACSTVCPRNIISMVPFKTDAMFVVACSNKDKGPVVKEVCEVGCIGCTACSRKADLIQMGDNLPVVDYGSYDHSADFEIAMDKCPRGSMLYVGKPTAKDIAAVAGEELPARIEADFKTTVDETEWRG